MELIFSFALPPTAFHEIALVCVILRSTRPVRMFTYRMALAGQALKRPEASYLIDIIEQILTQYPF
jgi:hypothetical protein